VKGKEYLWRLIGRRRQRWGFFRGRGAGDGDGLAVRGVCRHMGGLELAKLVTKLAAEYNDAWLVVERNNHGSGVLAFVETSASASGCTDKAAGGVVDDFRKPAGGVGEAGRRAGGAAGVLSEPEASGGVQEFCEAAERRNGSAGRGRTTTG